MGLLEGHGLRPRSFAPTSMSARSSRMRHLRARSLRHSPKAWLDNRYSRGREREQRESAAAGVHAPANELPDGRRPVSGADQPPEPPIRCRLGHPAAQDRGAAWTLVPARPAGDLDDDRSAGRKRAPRTMCCCGSSRLYRNRARQCSWDWRANSTTGRSLIGSRRHT